MNVEPMQLAALLIEKTAEQQLSEQEEADLVRPKRRVSAVDPDPPTGRSGFPAFVAFIFLQIHAGRVGVLPRRDNFFSPPAWLNRLLEAEIVWEDGSGLARHLPFGVALLCVGRRGGEC